MNALEALDPPRLDKHAALVARVYRETQGVEYVRKAAAIAKTAFQVAGKTEEPEYRIFSNMLQDPVAGRGQLKLASVVMQCLGRVHQKQAGPIGTFTGIFNAARNAVGFGTTAAGEAARLTGLLGAGLGVAGGGGLWALKRGIGGENQKLRELEIQRDTYHQLAAEVAQELKRRKMKPTPDNTAAVVDYIT